MQPCILYSILEEASRSINLKYQCVPSRKSSPNLSFWGNSLLPMRVLPSFHPAYSIKAPHRLTVGISSSFPSWRAASAYFLVTVASREISVLPFSLSCIWILYSQIGGGTMRRNFGLWASNAGWVTMLRRLAVYTASGRCWGSPSTTASFAPKNTVFETGCIYQRRALKEYNLRKLTINLIFECAAGGIIEGSTFKACAVL